VNVLSPGERRELDDLVLTWPREVEVAVGGWCLRTGAAPGLRSNFAYAFGDGGERGADWLARLAGHFAARGREPAVRVAPLGSGPQLDRELEARGWLRRGATRVLVRDLVPRSAPADPEVRREEEPRAFPAALVRVLGGGVFERAALEHGLGQVLASPLPLLLEREGEGIAAALGLLAGEWLGVVELGTLEGHRRRGLGRRLLRELCAIGHELGARRAWAAVPRTDDAGTALALRAGFREEYEFHCRTGPGTRQGEVEPAEDAALEF
jgi:GNAT superfamily N-acetyltransferase